MFGRWVMRRTTDVFRESNFRRFFLVSLLILIVILIRS